MEKITYTNIDGEEIILWNRPPYTLNFKRGFAAAENLIHSQRVYGMDGRQIISQQTDARELMVRGYVNYDSHDELLELRQEMIRVFDPKRSGTLTYENNIGTYEIDVIPEIPPYFNEDEITIRQPYEIVMQALDPYWKDKSEIDSEIPMSKVYPKMTFPLNLTPDFEFARLVAGDVIEIQNNGHVAVGAVFTITVNGPLVNPRLYNVVTQEYFALNGTFMTGSKLRISTVRGQKRVEQDDGDGWYNIMTKRKVESKFLQIDKGINYLQLQADEGVEFTTSFIKFEPKILGV